MRVRFTSFIFALMLAPSASMAETLYDTAERISKPTEQAAQEPRGASVIALPIPISDPAIGTGLGAGAIALYQPDADSRAWSTGVGGLYTDSSTWAVVAFQRMHFRQDSIRFNALAGYGDFHLSFYGIGTAAGDRGISVGLLQTGAGLRIDGLARVAPNLYLGARYRAANIHSTVTTSALSPDFAIPPLELQSAISSLGLAAQYDTRDSEYGPRRGLLGEVQLLFADEAIGSDFNYPRLEAALNGYHTLGHRVIAWRGSACWSGEHAPFYDLCNYGSQNDLRGYPIGQYRDHAMIAAQIELRQPLWGRFGAVAFAGVGGIAPTIEDIGALLPSVGIGLRFEASRQYRVNVGVDYAVGNTTSAFYFRIGEAF